MLTESLLLSFAGGALGLLVALWGVRFLDFLGAASMPRAEEPTVDSAVLVFTMAVAVMAAVTFGLAPALQLTRADLQRWLREGMRGQSVGPSLLGTRNLLIVAEVALSLMLLVGACLLYGVTATDSATYVTVSGLLAAAALLATLLPAERATKTDPAQALRAE